MTGCYSDIVGHVCDATHKLTEEPLSSPWMSAPTSANIEKTGFTGTCLFCDFFFKQNGAKTIYFTLALTRAS